MSIQVRLTRLIALLAIGAGLSACSSSPPPQKAVATPAPPAPSQPATLGQIKTDLLNVKAQMEVTTESANAVGKSNSADAQTNFNRFSTEYAKLSAMVESNRKRVDDLKSRTQQYYDAWTKEAEVTNPDLKRRITQQRSDAEKVFSTIKSEMELGRLAFKPYMTNLKDAETYLRGDMSPARVAAVSDLISKANEDGKSVGQHIDAVVAEIDKMMAASGDAQPAPSAPR